MTDRLHSSHTSLYPLHTPFNTTHHYYKYHMKRYHQRYKYSPQRVGRRAHFYVKGADDPQPLPQILGDFSSTLPSHGGSLLLSEGDLILVYGNDIPSNVIYISGNGGGSGDGKELRGEERRSEEECLFQIKGMNPGSCLVHFYLVCQTNSLLSHLTPDHQPMDFYPSLLRSHLQPEQYLSRLFTLTVHVQEYSEPVSSTAGSNVGCDELVTVVELALNSSLDDEIQSKEILLCSQFMLTKVPLLHHLYLSHQSTLPTDH
jgi:hypothetical protein